MLGDRPFATALLGPMGLCAGTAERLVAISKIRSLLDELSPPPTKAGEAFNHAAALGDAVMAVEIEPAPATGRPGLSAGGLRERLESIAQDIEDALGDACDDDVPRDAIKALVVAGGATRRALQALVC